MNQEKNIVIGNGTAKEVLTCLKGFKKPENHVRIQFYKSFHRDKAVHTVTAICDGSMIEKAFFSGIPQKVQERMQEIRKKAEETQKKRVSYEELTYEAVCHLSEFIEILSPVVSLGEEIGIINEEAFLGIRAGKRAAVKISKCSEKEMEATFPQDGNSVLFNMSIKGKDFLRMVKKGCYAYSEDSPEMTGAITFVLDDTVLKAYSTDGHMMGKGVCLVERMDKERKVCDADGNPVIGEDGAPKTENAFAEFCRQNGREGQPYVFSIPSGSFKKLVELAGNAENILFSVCPKQVMVGLPGIMLTIVSGNVKGTEWSQFESFFNCPVKSRLVIDKEEFVKNMAVLSLGRTGIPVRFTVENDSLVAEKEDARTILPLIKKDGDSVLPMGFNVKKLLKAFNSLDNGNVTMEITSQTKAAYFYNGERNSEQMDISLVLPVNLLADTEEGAEEETQEE